MELILQKGLPHQLTAVNAVCDVFRDIPFMPQTSSHQCPMLNYEAEETYRHIEEIQQANDISPACRKVHRDGTSIHLDIKMETGTGKTYVYTQTIFELHKRYGINKFIIFVPSLPVKAGTAQFMASPNTIRHFKDVCGYDTTLELRIVEAQKKGSQKKGRNNFPLNIGTFVQGSIQNRNKIYVLLMNSALLTNAKILTQEYDSSAEGYFQPLAALNSTRPFVIIDEPHRFSCDQMAYQKIIKEICPQCILRYGATFPEITSGKGKDKKTEKDYQNLLYDLNSCQAFNRNLIKGIAKEHLEPLSGSKDEKVRITSVARNDCAHFLLISGKQTTSYILHTGDPLSLVHPAFEGIYLTAITATGVEFSNQTIKQRGEEMDVDIFMSSYQEQMLILALKRHFETERRNFERSFRIKTLALFFIDNRHSYRSDKSDEHPYLKEMFEKALKQQLEKELKHPVNEAYREYIEASLQDLSACHGGYFANDNDSSDEEVARETKEILHDKMALLSFKHEDGSYNTRRFIFSQWALKEGWDNPNVFTICKLRSSGSETSKLQEVGRGLRLPVDEFGTRIAKDEFTLNYIVDFTERDFAEQLVQEINKDVPATIYITTDKIRKVAGKRGLAEKVLFMDLIANDYIDMDFKINPAKRDVFFTAYPEFETGLADDKVTDRNTGKNEGRKVQIRPDNYRELRNLWEKINEKYLLFLEKEVDGMVEDALYDILCQNPLITYGTLYSNRDEVSSDGETMKVKEGTGFEFQFEKRLPYNLFLKRLHQRTFVPLQTLHRVLCKYHQEQQKINDRQINEFSLSNIIKAFNNWKYDNLQGRFNYSKANLRLKGTALSNPDGSPKKEIVQGIIGTRLSEGIPPEKYLYNAIAYDSPLEQTNIISDVDNVIVYGKIPRRSIAIPTFDGGTYSPDFMYVVQRKDGSKELNIIVETKDIVSENDLRGTERAKINSAEIFFDQLKLDGYRVHYQRQIQGKSIQQLIAEIQGE